METKVVGGNIAMEVALSRKFRCYCLLNGVLAEKTNVDAGLSAGYHMKQRIAPIVNSTSYSSIYHHNSYR